MILIDSFFVSVPGDAHEENAEDFFQRVSSTLVTKL